MSKTLVGISTFGNFDFTRLAVRSIKETSVSDVDICLVVGNPDDKETIGVGDGKLHHLIIHSRNEGFPVAINDIYDTAWKHNDYDYCVIMGNDVVAYPGCIDGMIAMAETGRFDMVCATQIDVQGLVAAHPYAAQYFHGPNYVFNDFDARPWELHTLRTEYGEEPGAMKDIRNMALFTKGAFIKLGYCDVNYWPNGYFEDNCTARRGVLSGLNVVGAPHCEFFHFWSRTIHQGPSRKNHEYFRRNEEYYRRKWGGDWTQEKFTVPFNGKPYRIGGVELEPTLHIGHRRNEEAIVNYWSKL